MTTKEKIEVMQAFEDGRTVQITEQGLDEWTDVWVAANIDWMWGVNNYRIKPEPTVRPWDVETFPRDRPVWVKRPRWLDGTVALVLNTFNDGAIIQLSRNTHELQTWGQLLADYVQHDGPPCGITEGAS